MQVSGPAAGLTVIVFDIVDGAIAVSGDGRVEHVPKVAVAPALEEFDIVRHLRHGFQAWRAAIILEVAGSLMNDLPPHFIKQCDKLTLDGAMSPQAVAMGGYRPKMIDARLEYVDQSPGRVAVEPLKRGRQIAGALRVCTGTTHDQARYQPC